MRATDGIFLSLKEFYQINNIRLEIPEPITILEFYISLKVSFSVEETIQSESKILRIFESDMNRRFADKDVEFFREIIERFVEEELLVEVSANNQDGDEEHCERLYRLPLSPEKIFTEGGLYHQKHTRLADQFPAHATENHDNNFCNVCLAANQA